MNNFSTSQNNSKKNGQPVVFLDRDGTLNVEVGYIRNLDDLVLIEGAAKAVQKLNQNNIAAVLVTNQTGAARGYYPEIHIKDLNNRLAVLLKEKGAYLDAVYYCPHLPEGSNPLLALKCNCRKPAPGMVEQAYMDFPNFDKNRSFVVGDKATDVGLARQCGAKAVLVETGYGSAVKKGEYQWVVEPDFHASDIGEAVDWILSQVSEK
jgi:D-glycero-D-manno-heptose 1,7-bisphosphate phosphatase